MHVRQRSEPQGRRAKKKAYWERYVASKTEGADQPQQQQQQQQPLDHPNEGTWRDVGTGMDQTMAVGAQGRASSRQQGAAAIPVLNRFSRADGPQQRSAVTQVFNQSSPHNSQQQLSKRQRQQQRQQQQEPQDVQLQGGGAAAGSSVGLPKALATINMKVPAQRLQVVRSLCGLMRGLQVMGHPYDRVRLRDECWVVHQQSWLIPCIYS
eukprot:scaffold133077_cov19-Tisochrysis_lutea.AAC.3